VEEIEVEEEVLDAEGIGVGAETKDDVELEAIHVEEEED
jgi:hypothetical protein